MKQVSEDEPENQTVSANGASQQAVSQIKALQDVQGTRTLVGSRAGQITLKFDPSLDFVKVQFKFDNQNIKIERGGEVGDECGFALKFEQDEKREATFDIRTRTIEKESEEPLDISCQDKDGNSLGSTRRYWINLKTEEQPLEPPADYRFVPWVVYVIRLGRKSRVFYLLLVVVVAVPLFIFRVPPTDKVVNWVQRVNDFVQIKLRTKDPNVYSQPWSDPFLPTNDNRPDQSKWLAPKEWTLVNGENDNDTDKALRVDADGVGLNRLPSDLYALYDYQVTFPLNISENQGSARWVVRAQSPQDYYLFELTLPTNNVSELKLEGFVYADGIKGQPLTDLTPVRLEFFKFHEGDLLTVTITVNNFEFKHAFNLNLHEANDEDNPNFDKQGSDKIKTFSDINSKYRYGAFGFQARDRCVAFKVESVEIGNIK